MKTIRAILIGIGIWILAVSFYTLSFQFQILEDSQEQANIALFTVILPLVWLGAYLYYKHQNSHGAIVGLIFFLVAGILDVLITVPLFVIPNGGTHLEFFTDLGFWSIGLEMIIIVLVYYFIYVQSKANPLKA